MVSDFVKNPIVIKNPKVIASIIPFVIGFIIVVNSAIKLQYSLEMKKVGSIKLYQFSQDRNQTGIIIYNGNKPIKSHDY